MGKKISRVIFYLTFLMIASNIEQITIASSIEQIYRVYATQYRAYTDWEVALPYTPLKSAWLRDSRKAYWVKIQRPEVSNIAVNVPIKEVGPWNENDNYWEPELLKEIYEYLRLYWQRHDSPKGPVLPPLWNAKTFIIPPKITSLDQGIPESFEAYITSEPYTATSYNYGCDQFGRHRWYESLDPDNPGKTRPERLNGAGIDLSDGVRRALGLEYLQNAWVDVTFFSKPPTVDRVIIIQNSVIIYDSRTGIKNYANIGKIEIRIFFNETMNTLDVPVVRFGRQPPYNKYAFANGIWLQNKYKSDTWVGTFNITSSNIEEIVGENQIIIDAKNLGNLQIDNGEKAELYEPGLDQNHRFRISNTPCVIKYVKAKTDLEIYDKDGNFIDNIRQGSVGIAQKSPTLVQFGYNTGFCREDQLEIISIKIGNGIVEFCDGQRICNIVAREEDDNYFYYKFNYGGNPLIPEYSRQILELNSGVVIIYERQKQNYFRPQKFVLYPASKPDLDQSNCVLRIQDYNGQNAYLRIMLPASPKINGGPNNGQSQDLYTSNQWITEVIQTSSKNLYELPNALYVMTLSEEQLSPQRISLIDGQGAVGIRINDCSLLFNRTDSFMNEAQFSLNCDSGDRIIFRDLSPNTSYTISDNGDEKNFSANENGLLTFTLTSAGQHNIKLTKVFQSPGRSGKPIHVDN